MENLAQYITFLTFHHALLQPSWPGLLPCWTWAWPAEVILGECDRAAQKWRLRLRSACILPKSSEKYCRLISAEFPHQFPPTKQPGWRLLYLAKKEKAQLWNVLRGFIQLITGDNNNHVPVYFAGQICVSVIKEKDWASPTYLLIILKPYPQSALHAHPPLQLKATTSLNSTTLYDSTFSGARRWALVEFAVSKGWQTPNRITWTKDQGDQWKNVSHCLSKNEVLE